MSCFISASFDSQQKSFIFPRILSAWKFCISLLLSYCPFYVLFHQSQQYVFTQCTNITECVGGTFFLRSVCCLGSPLGLCCFCRGVSCLPPHSHAHSLWVSFPNLAASSSQEFLFLSLIMQEGMALQGSNFSFSLWEMGREAYELQNQMTCRSCHENVQNMGRKGWRERGGWEAEKSCGVMSEITALSPQYLNTVNAFLIFF